MTTSGILLEDFDIETAMTRRILERVPEDKPDWTPHPKSMPMGRLAMHIATLPLTATTCIATSEFDIAAHEPLDLTFHSRHDLLSVFDNAVSEARAALEQVNDDHLSKPWRLSFGDRLLTDSPRAIILLHTFIGHMIHHRAQLGVYLRLNDLAVPGVYGPSADER